MNKKEREIEQAKLLKEILEKLDTILAIISIDPPASQHGKIKKRKKEKRLQAGF